VPLFFVATSIDISVCMALTADGGCDKPGCLMCKSQDSVLYAVPVFTDDIDAWRGEDITSKEGPECSIEVCDRCLLFFASKRLLAFQLSGAARHSINFLEQRCRIKIDGSELEATHSSLPPRSCQTGMTETKDCEERKDSCPNGEGHVCPSEMGLDVDSDGDDMTLEEMREILQELEAIVPSLGKVPKSRSAENKHKSNTVSPTHECCPKEESADLTTPHSQQPRNACDLGRDKSKTSLPGKWWSRSFSSSFPGFRRRKSRYTIDMTGVVFEDGIPACWDLAKPCDHRLSSSSQDQISSVSLAASEVPTQPRKSSDQDRSKGNLMSMSTRRRERDATRFSPSLDFDSSVEKNTLMTNLWRKIKGTRGTHWGSSASPLTL
jgi:hypothetical protein